VEPARRLESVLLPSTYFRMLWSNGSGRGRRGACVPE
jgi:hypothetical protein